MGYVGIDSDEDSLRVQVPNMHILTQHLYYNYYYQNPKYPIIGHGPLGIYLYGYGLGLGIQDHLGPSGT